MGPVVSEKKIFYFFSHSKSMETINPRGVAKFDPRGMNGTIHVEDHKPLLHTKYQSCWPSGFREVDFFSFFPIVGLWRLSTPGGWPNLTPGA